MSKLQMLSFKIPMIATVVSVMGVSGMLWSSTAQMRSAVSQSQAGFVEASVEQSIGQITEYLNTVRLLTGSMARSGAAQAILQTHGSGLPLHPSHRTQIEEMSQIVKANRIIVLNKSGEIAHASGTAELNETISNLHRTLINGMDEGGSGLSQRAADGSQMFLYYGAVMRGPDGARSGALIIEIGSDALAGLLARQNAGRDTAESYLVGQTNQYLTAPLSKPALAAHPITDGLGYSLLGQGVQRRNDRDQVETLAGAGVLDIYGHETALVYKVDTSEFSGVISDALLMLLLQFLVTTALTTIAVQIYTRSIVKPIKSLEDNARAMSAGEYDVSFPTAERSDEVGSIGKALKAFSAQLKDAREADKKRESDAAQKLREQQRIANEIEAFKVELKRIMELTDTEVLKLSEVAHGLAQATREANKSVSTIESNASETLGIITTVAAATEQMSGSIYQINDRTQNAEQQIERTAQIVMKLLQDISELKNMSEEITRVIDMIHTIARKTNMLAMNATIEASHAGEAGLGFAVVAQGVRDLSEQTTKSIKEITGQINSIKGATDASLGSIGEVVTSFDELRQALLTIAASLESQSHATSEIARSAHSANAQTQRTSESILSVGQTVEKADQSASQMEQTANALKKAMTDLTRRIDQFFGAIS